MADVASASAQELWLRLPQSLRCSLGPAGSFPDCEVLDAICLDDADRRQFLADFAADAGELSLLVSVLKALQDKVQLLAEQKRKRRANLHPSLQYLSLLKRPRAELVAPVESLQWLLRHSGAQRAVRAIGRPRLRGAIEGRSRADLEDSQLARWRGKVASILLEASVPALLAVDADDAGKLAVRLCGTARASTLKKHVQMWFRYTKWLAAAYNVIWPSQVAMVLDFLEELAAQPCGATVPYAFLCTLSFMERLGGYGSEEKLATNTAVQACANQLQMQLEMGAAPPKKARPQPLLLLIALELFVVFSNAPRYWRAFAWVKLLKFWTSSRTDDLAGLLPASLTLDTWGLSGTLQRTKTSGPGKKVKWLPIFVDAAASFSGVDWLTTGFRIWKSADMDFPRDYFLPLPSADWECCRACIADYTAFCTLSKGLYQQLMLPAWRHSAWHLTEGHLLISHSAGRAWSEHSERCWMATVAALLNIPREKREFLGRWRVACCSDEYLRSARSIVRQLQRDIVAGVLGDLSGEVKSIGLSDLELHLRQAGEPESVVKDQLSLLDVGRWSAPPPVESFEAPGGAALPAKESDNESAASLSSEEEYKYFVCITKNRRYRRLHRWNGCGSKPGRNIATFEGFSDLKGVQYDAACRHCWKDGRAEDADNVVSSSSSGSTDDSLA